MTFLKSARLVAARRFPMLACGALALATLSGCSSHHDCTSSAVEGLMIEILESRAIDKRVRDAAGEASLRNIVTEDAQEDLGRYQCVGELVYTPAEGNDVVTQVNYGVQQLQNSDDEFELTYQEPQLVRFEFGVALRQGISENQAMFEAHNEPR